MKRSIRVAGVAAAAGALVVTGVQVGVASTSDTVYSACLTNGGTLYSVTTETAQCNPADTLIDWNRQGPVGPVGPVGPEGPKGDPGGALAYHDVNGTWTAMYKDVEVEVASVALPAGAYSVTSLVRFDAAEGWIDPEVAVKGVKFSCWIRSRAHDNTSAVSNWGQHVFSFRGSSHEAHPLAGMVTLTVPSDVYVVCTKWYDGAMTLMPESDLTAIAVTIAP